MLQIARLRTWSDATLGREAKPIPSPESPRQVNAGREGNPSGVIAPAPLNGTLYGDSVAMGFSESSCKRRIVPPIHAKSASIILDPEDK